MDEGKKEHAIIQDLLLRTARLQDHLRTTSATSTSLQQSIEEMGGDGSSVKECTVKLHLRYKSLCETLNDEAAVLQGRNEVIEQYLNGCVFVRAWCGTSTERLTRVVMVHNDSEEVREQLGVVDVSLGLYFPLLFRSHFFIQIYSPKVCLPLFSNIFLTKM